MGVFKEEKAGNSYMKNHGYDEVQYALDIENELFVKLFNTEDEIFIPTKAHIDDAGYDCRARIDEPYVLKPMARVKIPLGFGINIPKLHTGDVRPRSGLTDRNGLIVGYGTGDPGYINEISATIFNLGEEDYVIEPRSRIAQLVVLPTVQSKFNNNPVQLRVVDELIPLERGMNGHGSTGTK